MSLCEKTKEYYEAGLAKRSPELTEIMKKSAEKLIEDEVGKNALKMGDKIPNFTLNNASGKEIRIYDLLTKGPLIINFYRGAWCPYCNFELLAYKEILPEIKEVGANLVAISPELPDNSLSLMDKHELMFEILSDYENNVAKQFGLVFKLDKDLLSLYDKMGFNLEASQGTNNGELPIPATYVVDKNGHIQMAYVNTDYTQRLEPVDTLSVLKKLREE